MQSASREFNVYSRFIEPDESLYSNIDPRTGSVVTYDYTAIANNMRLMNEYNNSGLNLSSIDTLSRRREGPEEHGCGEMCKRAFGHLLKLDIILKYIEIIILGVCGSLFSGDNHFPTDNTTFIVTVIVPMVVFVVFFTLAFSIMICLFCKVRVSNIFLIIINTLAVLLISVSGGVLLGVWLNIPKANKYWESLAKLSQTVFSFIAALIYVIDLAWSLNSLDKLP